MGDLLNLATERARRCVRWSLSLVAGGYARTEAGVVSVSLAYPQVRGPQGPKDRSHAPLYLLPRTW